MKCTFMQHGISYRAKKPKALCLRLRYFGFFFLSEKNFKRPMHTEAKDPSLYLCTALSRISDTVNASHHHLRHRHDNCINVSQHALLFLSRFVELKTVFTIALSGKKHNPVFPIFLKSQALNAKNITGFCVLSFSQFPFCFFVHIQQPSNFAISSLKRSSAVP